MEGDRAVVEATNCNLDLRSTTWLCKTLKPSREYDITGPNSVPNLGTPENKVGNDLSNN